MSRCCWADLDGGFASFGEEGMRLFSKFAQFHFASYLAWLG